MFARFNLMENKKLKICNLYCGIGGNRKLWNELGDFDITAIENDPKIAAIYHDFFPKDKVIVSDAHQFLLEHFSEYDFIWSSPPCTTHSSMAKLCGLSDDVGRGNHNKKPTFPDMKLYEEILFLQTYFKGKYVIENVIPFYSPLIPAQKIQRHLFWSNFLIPPQIKVKADNIKYGKVREWEGNLGYDLSKYKNLDKRKVLRNCVNPELGKYILDLATKENTLL